MESAAQRVFRTGELVQAILTALTATPLPQHEAEYKLLEAGVAPCSSSLCTYEQTADLELARKALFTCQLVNTTCKAAIDHCSHLQRALYFRSDEAIGPCCDDHATSPQPFQTKPAVTGSPRLVSVHSHHLNLLLVSQRQYYLDSGGWFSVAYPSSDRGTAEREVGFRLHNDDAAPTGSWRKMYVFNKEYRVARIALQWSTFRGDWREAVYVGDVVGCTVGEMFDLVMRQCEEEHSSVQLS